MTTWNAAFEASPADSDERKYGAAKIRELKTAISDRDELEHNFKAGTQPYHKAGKCSVEYAGTTADITALTGMSANSIAWDTTLKVLKRYTGAAWEIKDVDHGALSGKSDDDHPQYLKLDKASQTLSQNLAVSAGITIDGRDISADGTTLDGHTTSIAANAASIVSLQALTKVVQVVNYQTGAKATGSTIMPFDDTIPKQTEGTEFMTLAITPKKTTNKLIIDVVFHGSVYYDGITMSVALFQDATEAALAAAAVWVPSVSGIHTVTFRHYMAAGTISLTTFKVRAGPSGSADMYFNAINNARYFGGVFASSITIFEYGLES